MSDRDNGLMEQIINLAPYSDIPDEANCKQLFDFIQSQKENWQREAVNDFCADIRHKVEVSFNMVPPGMLAMPWEQVVRPIIYKRAGEVKKEHQ